MYLEIYYAEARDVNGVPTIYYIDSKFKEGSEVIFTGEMYLKEKDAIRAGVSFYVPTDVKTMYGESLVAVKTSSLMMRRYLNRMFCSKKFGEPKTKCISSTIYNSDIDLVKIWMYDNDHEPMDYLENPLFFDIEVQVENFMEKYNSKDPRVKYDNRILVISWYDMSGRGGVIMDDDEAQLITKFYNKARKYTCIIGWNSKDFDFPYIVNRAKRLGLEFNWRMIPQFDLMKAYRKYAEGVKEYYEVVSYRLDAAARKYLGEDKGKVEIRYEDIDRLYKEDRAYLAYYCLQDSKLLYDLYKAIPELKDILRVDVMLMKATKVLPYENSTTFYVTSVLDKMLYERRIAIPSVGTWKYYGMGNSKTGGFVLEPVKGLARNVVAVDYKSLYPSIMITHNIGMNTLHEVEQEGDIRTEHLPFSSDEEGYLSEMMKIYMNKRFEYRQKRDEYEVGTKEYVVYDAYQLALKLLINGTNGALTKESLRYHNNLIYNSVVDTGHMYIKFLVEAAEENGFKVHYGDSVRGDMRVTIEENQQIKIEDLFKEVTYRIEEKEYYIPEEDVYALSMRKDGKLEYKKIKYVMRHYIKDDIREMSIDNKKKIYLTKNHSVMRYIDIVDRQDGNIFENVNPDDLIDGGKVIFYNNTKSIYEVKEIEKIKSLYFEGYVYDIEVEDNHNFFVENILVHNTDSVYITTPYKSLEEVVDNVESIDKILYEGVRKKAIKYYNIPEERYSMYPRTEKVMSEVYFLSKKMYFMHVKWKDGHFTDKYEPKGIAVVRENTLPLKRMVLRHLFENYILTDKSGYEDEVIDYLLKLKMELFSGKRDDLITQSQRVREIKNHNTPYFVAARKLLEKGQFLPGDVVEYIQLYDGYVYVPKIEKREIGFKTYKKYWNDLGKWIHKLFGYKISGDPELGFKVSVASKDLLSIVKEG